MGYIARIVMVGSGGCDDCRRRLPGRVRDDCFEEVVATWEPGPHSRLIVRVDPKRVSPPIWRRLDIRSDLTLDQVHVVIQAAFDWQNSHLHEFTKAKTGGGRDYTRFVDTFLLDEDVFGGSDIFGTFGHEIDESTVQLATMLVEPKDVLDYQYDFGDSWDHKVRLQRIRGSADDELPVICLGGRRAAAADEFGGIWQYQWLIEAGLDPAHPVFGGPGNNSTGSSGEDVTFDPEAFDVKRIKLPGRLIFRRGGSRMRSVPPDSSAIMAAGSVPVR